jgi:hypothetical protein
MALQMASKRMILSWAYPEESGTWTYHVVRVSAVKRSSSPSDKRGSMIVLEDCIPEKNLEGLKVEIGIVEG